MGCHIGTTRERKALKPLLSANTGRCRMRACEEVGEAPDLGQPRAHQHNCLIVLWERACARGGRLTQSRTVQASWIGQ